MIKRTIHHRLCWKPYLPSEKILMYKETEEPYLCCSSVKGNEQGFTLVELLIAIAISLVVLAGLSGAFVSQRKTYAVQEQVSDMIQNARAAMDMITREIKMAGYAPTGYDRSFEENPTLIQTSPLMQRKDPTKDRYLGIAYNPTKLEIIADLNGDGDTGDDNELIKYEEDSTNLKIKRTAIIQGQTITVPLAENIEDFSFKYFMNNSTPGDPVEVTTSADQQKIRLIEISITARTANPDPNYTSNGGFRTYTLTARITPPNLDL